MKPVSLLLLLVGTFSLVSCTKDFDVRSPDVDAFVKMIKQGSYETKVGTELPNFSASDIPQLMKYVDDMTEVAFFPVNPMSSFGFFSPVCLGEKILWVIQGVSSGTKYASLGGYIVHKQTHERISAEELKALLSEYKRVFSDYSSSSCHLSTYIEQTPYGWR